MGVRPHVPTEALFALLPLPLPDPLPDRMPPRPPPLPVRIDAFGDTAYVHSCGAYVSPKGAVPNCPRCREAI